MKITKVFSGYLSGALLLLLALIGCAPVSTDVKSEIEKVNEGFIAAYNSGDAKTLATNYIENAKLYPSNSDIVEGSQAIEGFWNAVMHMGIKKAKLETVKADKIGNIAIEEGMYTLFVDGDIAVDHGKYIVTWEKIGGDWKIARDIWNTNNPAQQARADVNGAVWVLKNCVKADKVAQFEEFNLNYLKVAAEEKAPELMKTVRFLKPNGPNKDGTFNYFYVMDPALSNSDYDMAPILTAKYGKEKADEYLKMYNECLKSYEANFATQMGW